MNFESVDQYLAASVLHEDPALTATLENNRRSGLSAIDVSPTQGKLLHIYARMIGARRILEIGTLGGYSAIWMAKALPPEGRLISLEFSPKHAEIARENIKNAGLSDRIEIRVGAALDLLPSVEGPFDLVFIDADKVNSPNYYDWALKLTRKGSVIIVDNVVRSGRVIETSSGDANIEGNRKLFEKLSTDTRVTATAIQTVGSKGWDGFAIAVVN